MFEICYHPNYLYKKVFVSVAIQKRATLICLCQEIKKTGPSMRNRPKINSYEKTKTKSSSFVPPT
ncbi:MAG: hypothetical protein B6D64_05715 [Bacteroidetes bacterium 4484_276]|nr:MAG: hypothetical protein B6D64_05715 [Bacteroidetes bacterium 4484_276]